ncbi:MAG: imidazole glycerol phosphate synthase subunit HisH [Lachnospiraceae bacterium]|nr:imidazole glycerol phosphate synthase subunit HisH [Lachnospiraceae bacterium]
MIAIIDYDAGNIKSVEKAVDFLGHECVTTRDSKAILNADHVILPGVGAFGDAMDKLKEYGLIDVIKKVCEDGTPFLGICLGLQLLFESSEESPGIGGLSILKGKIKRLPEGAVNAESDAGKKADSVRLKVPNIGWNSLTLRGSGRLFSDVPDESFVYFVHSYYLDAEDKSIVKATIEYGTRVDASVESGNIFACQFHPEKSSETGLSILENFLNV